MKFKVGDKVRFIEDYGRNCKRGDVCKVLSITRSGLVIVEHSNGDEYHVFDYRLELVEEGMSELEELVRKANEGFEACRTIRLKFPGSCEVNNTYGWESMVGKHAAWQVRVKQKSFKPFRTQGDCSWLVKLEGDTVHVGCKTFKASTLKSALTLLNKAGGTHSDFTCNRIGPQFYDRKEDKHYGISWEDSERIVAALEKAGIK